VLDWLVTGGVLTVNPAHAVRGPKHVVKRGKTSVLTYVLQRSWAANDILKVSISYFGGAGKGFESGGLDPILPRVRLFQSVSNQSETDKLLIIGMKIPAVSLFQRSRGCVI
jgi:hypothetical protein